MWLRLDDNETGFLIELLARELNEKLHTDEVGQGKVKALLERLNEPPPEHYQAFVNAVDTSDDLEVDGDAVLSESDDGAFVMCWYWVSNEDAGIEPHEPCNRCGEEHPVGVLEDDMCPACVDAE